MKIKMFASILIIKMLTYFYDVVFEKNVNRIDVVTNVQETEEIENIKKLMEKEAKKENFMQAAVLRDELFKYKKLLLEKFDS